VGFVVRLSRRFWAFHLTISTVALVGGYILSYLAFFFFHLEGELVLYLFEQRQSSIIELP